MALFIVKGLFLMADSRPQIYQGDSITFLQTAWDGYIPVERSFVYGYMLHSLALWLHSFHTVVLFQVLVSTFSAWIIAICLIRYFQVSFAIAAICSLLCACEPLQLLMERYVMTECTALFLFALFLLAAFEYLHAGKILFLVLVQFAGVLLVSLRFNFLPEVLLTSMALPLLTPGARSVMTKLCHCQMPSNRPLWRGMIVPLVLSVALSQGLLCGYRHLNGTLSNKPPAYLYADGYFLLSDFAPIVLRSDFPIPQDWNKIVGKLGYALSNPDKREEQRWHLDGICQVMIAEYGQDQSNQLARQTALHALERDPLAAIRLSAFTFSEYFNDQILQAHLKIGEDYNRRLTDSDLLQFRERFHEDLQSPNPSRDTVTKNYHRASGVWIRLLLVSPAIFALFLIVRHNHVTVYSVICLTLAIMFFLNATVTVESPTPRYLIGMAWLFFLILGVMGSDLNRFLFTTGNREK